MSSFEPSARQPADPLPAGDAARSAAGDAVRTPHGDSPLMSLPGAVAVPASLDAGQAWHYGDPLREQRVTESGPILLDGWAREAITVTGPDRLTWLHSLGSQHFEHLRDGDATQSLWLSTRGHVEHWADAAELDAVVQLRTEPGSAGALLGFLESMKFWSDVALADVSSQVATLTVAGKGFAETVADVLGVTVAAGHATPLPGMTSQPGTASFLRGYPDRVDVVIPRSEVGRVASELLQAGATAAGTWAGDALRIAARRPRFGIDSDDRTIPNEMPWLASAVHLDKGCYRGQETVARVSNLGQPPRRMVLLNLDGSQGELPSPGEAVTTTEGRTVGRVGSVAYHWEDGPIALALVKRTIGPDTPLVVGGVDASVDPDDQPITARSAAVDRGSFHNFKRR